MTPTANPCKPIRRSAGSAAGGRCSTTKASRSGSTSRSSARRHLYEVEREMTDTGVSPILFYDPGRASGRHTAPQSHLGKGRLRPVATEDLGCQRHRLIADPKTDDPTSAASSPACRTRNTCPPGMRRGRTANLDRTNRLPRQKAAVHADTPTVAYADSLGRDLPHRRAQPVRAQWRPRSRRNTPPVSCSTSKATSAK